MKHILSYLTITFLFTSCQLFEPKPESEKFYCKINGRAWRSEANSYSLGTNLKAEWNKKGSFNISAYNGTKTLILGIKLDPNTPLKNGLFLLDSTRKTAIGYYFIDESSSVTHTYISESGNILITKIESNKVSGTFEFKTYGNQTTGKVYKLTKGQFNDLAYSEIG